MIAYIRRLCQPLPVCASKVSFLISSVEQQRTRRKGIFKCQESYGESRRFLQGSFLKQVSVMQDSWNFDCS